MLPYPSSAGVSKYWGSFSHKLCGSQACYTVCYVHSLVKCSGCWLFPLTQCKRLECSWHSHVQSTLCCSFCYFSYCRKCFPRLKIVHPQENSCFWRSRRRACRLQLREYACHRLSKNDMYLDGGLKVSSGESKVFRHFVGNVCYMAHRVLWNKTLLFFLVIFCTQIHQFTLFSDVICSLVWWVLQWI